MDIDPKEGEGRPFGRFASLLAGDGCPRPEYDQSLFEISGCVVAPTLGSIVPKWLLVVPCIHRVSFAHWRRETGMEPDKLVSAVLERCGVNADRAIWFEHGPREGGSSLACGVDHAHLHVIIDAPFTFEEFVLAATDPTTLNWTAEPVAQVYQSVAKDTSYLVAASAKFAMVAQNVDAIGSQFFRRVIASLIRRPEVWDYKVHPHLENVRETLRTFGARSMESVRP